MRDRGRALPRAQHFVDHADRCDRKIRRLGRRQDPGLPAAFRASADEQILIVHIREPEEIERFRQAAGADCRTLLVRRPSLDARGPLGNRADDSVEQYQYDDILMNDGTIDDLRARVAALLAART